MTGVLSNRVPREMVPHLSACICQCLNKTKGASLNFQDDLATNDCTQTRRLPVLGDRPEVRGAA